MPINLHGKRTKIVATIGPASYDEDIMRAIIQAGVNVARINFSHGEHETHANAMAQLRRIAQEEGVVLAILGDLQGPKLRLGKFDSIRLLKGDQIVLTSRSDFDPTLGEVPLPHQELIKDVFGSQRLLIDDGEIELMVKEKRGGTDLLCETIIGGELKMRKGVSAPDSKLTLPAITEKDREDLRFALEQNVDWIAMSFVRRKEDIERLRWMIEELGGDIPIIAKIEKPEALDNIEEIISASDGVMVARGDLGVETSAAAVPVHQKRIIKLANQVGKPVITATQMLDSMIRNPRPTRAEASDVANAIFDGTDAIMLSGESASGEYPVEAVEMMATIASIAEEQLHEHMDNYQMRITRRWSLEADMHIGRTDSNTADAVSHATVEMAGRVGARMIVCSTWTGYTARRVARERPVSPIVCVTPNPRTHRRLALVWGVNTLLVEEYASIDQMFHVVEEAVVEAQLATSGDKLVIISGVPFGAAGSTNFVKIHQIT